MSENNISYPETIETAGEYLRMSLGLMSKYRTAATPVNYTVWYEYVAGNNPKLKKAVDALMKDLTHITPQHFQNVFNQYFVNGNRLINREVLTAIQKIVENVSQHVEENGRNVTERGENMQNSAGLLQEDLDVASIRNIVETIIKDTEAVVTIGKEFKAKLAEANSEVKTLRAKLEQSKAESQTDPLTSLINRRGLEPVLAGSMEEAGKSGTEMCIIMADIDHFKKINDKYGHLVGDNVIRMVATTLTDFVKGRDKVVRYGGEEYLVVLPDTALADALSLSEKIRSSLEKMQWKKRGSGESLGVITISIGVARYVYNESMESLIGRADKALYQAKENGRNRVSAAK